MSQTGKPVSLEMGPITEAVDRLAQNQTRIQLDAAEPITFRQDHSGHRAGSLEEIADGYCGAYRMTKGRRRKCTERTKDRLAANKAFTECQRTNGELRYLNRRERLNVDVTGWSKVRMHLFIRCQLEDASDSAVAATP